MSEKILGYDVDNQSVDVCVENIFKELKEKNRKRWLACLNPHSYVVALRDEHFFRSLKLADYLIADGIGIVYASRILGGNIKQRVTGFDIFRGLNNRMNEECGMSVFFLGSTEENLGIIRQNMARDYPNIKIVGVYSPPFSDVYSTEDLARIEGYINSVKPDVLWVGMTAPKQEKWIMSNISRLDVHFVGAIGAVFDFYTGKVKRTSPLIQRMGLEWLPRLIRQPKRLWKRMFISAPIFVWNVFIEYIHMVR